MSWSHRAASIDLYSASRNPVDRYQLLGDGSGCFYAHRIFLALPGKVPRLSTVVTCAGLPLSSGSGPISLLQCRSRVLILGMSGYTLGQALQSWQALLFEEAPLWLGCWGYAAIDTCGYSSSAPRHLLDLWHLSLPAAVLSWLAPSQFPSLYVTPIPPAVPGLSYLAGVKVSAISLLVHQPLRRVRLCHCSA